jgi:hypothetical protein
MTGKAKKTLLKSIISKNKPYKSGKGASMNKTKVGPKVTDGSPFKLSNGLPNTKNNALISGDDLIGASPMSKTGMF